MLGGCKYVATGPSAAAAADDLDLQFPIVYEYGCNAAAFSRRIDPSHNIGGNDPDPVFIRKKVYSRRFAAQIDSMSAGSMIGSMSSFITSVAKLLIDLSSCY